MSLLAAAVALAAAPGATHACPPGQLAWGGFSADAKTRREHGELAVSITPPVRVVMVKADGAAQEGPSADGEGEPRSVWVNNGDPSALCLRRLLAPRADDEPKRNLLGLTHPVFSLDGGYVYLEADAWATSPAVHQVNLSTGAERFMIDGGIKGVLRDGPYRGMLLVGRHKYRSAPQIGSYDSVDLVRPDGKVVLTVPGSEADEGDPSVGRWLKAHGWRAN